MKEMICPPDCKDRSVEPSCRATCAKWQEHEKTMMAIYEMRQQKKNAQYVSESYFRQMHKELRRRKQGRK